jgi:hypothetical protein
MSGLYEGIDLFYVIKEISRIRVKGGTRGMICFIIRRFRASFHIIYSSSSTEAHEGMENNLIAPSFSSLERYRLGH